MAKIIQERYKCIGCGTCAALCSSYWEMDEDGKSKLLGSEAGSKPDTYEREVKNIGCNQEAADSCPVNCIHIK